MGSHKSQSWLSLCILDYSGKGSGESGEGLRQLWKPVGENHSSEICSGPWQLCWLLVSLAVRAAGVLCRANHCELCCSCCMIDVGSPCPSFFLVSSPLYTWQLCWSLDGVKWSRSPCSVLSKAGETSHSPCFHFPGKETSLTGEFPLGPGQCWSEGWTDTGKMKLSSYSFCVVILWLFGPLCCWSFLSGLLSSPGAIVIHRKLS